VCYAGTFSDGKEGPVLKVLEDANMKDNLPSAKNCFFKFNNSAFFEGKQEEVSALCFNRLHRQQLF
jgi:hypothetical protein